MFTCKIWLRYSRERAQKVRKFELSEILNSNFEISKLLHAAQDTVHDPEQQLVRVPTKRSAQEALPLLRTDAMEVQDLLHLAAPMRLVLVREVERQSGDRRSRAGPIARVPF